MMALNFRAGKHKKMLMERRKKCTVRLGDVSGTFPEGSRRRAERKALHRLS